MNPGMSPRFHASDCAPIASRMAVSSAAWDWAPAFNPAQSRPVTAQRTNTMRFKCGPPRKRLYAKDYNGRRTYCLNILSFLNPMTFPFAPLTSNLTGGEDEDP